MDFLINWQGINEEVIVLALAGWSAISAVGNKWMASGSMVVGRGVGAWGGGKLYWAVVGLWVLRPRRPSTRHKRQDGEVKGGQPARLESRISEFRPWHPHLPAVWPWTSHGTSLSLRCPRGWLWGFDSDTCCHIDEPWKHYAKWNKPDSEGQGGWNGGLLISGYRISVWDDEKKLEIDSGDGYTTLWMYLMLLNCTPKNG